MYTLQSFIKANKARREKMAKNAGFPTAEAYAKFLGTPIRRHKFPKVDKEVTPCVSTDYVIAFDTTGSMASFIGAVKKHVTTLIPSLFDNIPNLRIKIVAFGDYCDMKSSQEFGKAYQESDLTNNQQALISFVNAAQNTTGGDGDEFYELVIRKITNETAWREGSNRSVLLIADADPHGRSYTYGGRTHNIDWREEAQKAKVVGIKFDTLSITGRAWYKELSQITDGVYAPFQSSGKTVDAVEASAYFRGAMGGSEKSRGILETKLTMAVASGDAELIGLYKAFSDKL